MSTTQVVLPDKPSALIRLALADLAKCEAMPEVYRIDMGRWHAANSHCSVCLAGAILAQSFGTPPTSDGTPWLYPTETKARLLALDWFRYGSIGIALAELKFARPAAIGIRRNITNHCDSPAAFRTDMETLASDLEREGM